MLEPLCPEAHEEEEGYGEHHQRGHLYYAPLNQLRLGALSGRGRGDALLLLPLVVRVAACRVL